MSNSKSANYLSLLNNKPQAPPPGDEHRIEPIYKNKDPIAKSVKERFDAGGSYICTARNDSKLPQFYLPLELHGEGLVIKKLKKSPSKRASLAARSFGDMVNLKDPISKSLKRRKAGDLGLHGKVEDPDAELVTNVFRLRQQNSTNKPILNKTPNKPNKLQAAMS